MRDLYGKRRAHIREKREARDEGLEPTAVSESREQTAS